MANIIEASCTALTLKHIYSLHLHTFMFILIAFCSKWSNKRVSHVFFAPFMHFMNKSSLHFKDECLRFLVKLKSLFKAKFYQRKSLKLKWNTWFQQITIMSRVSLFQDVHSCFNLRVFYQIQFIQYLRVCKMRTLNNEAHSRKRILFQIIILSIEGVHIDRFKKRNENSFHL